MRKFYSENFATNEKLIEFAYRISKPDVNFQPNEPFFPSVYY